MKDMLREKSNNPNLKGGEQPQPEGWGKNILKMTAVVIKHDVNHFSRER